ncbi:MAG: nicotinate (nicotinamide) nucleotide adenylyltransferase [Planctomycetes bacterium]|nr:nicotinate (nicotinamide) nucleotide adenylyltransferase [Planctomycetota bacterium]
MKLGILGGTFNPIHVGHLAVARAVRRALSLDRILFVPAGRPPHKTADLAPAEDRLEMVRRALVGLEGMEACDVEVRRDGLSYTVDTLEILRERYPEADLFFLIGSDTVGELESWRNLPRILEIVRLVVVNRPGHGADAGAGEAEPQAGPAGAPAGLELHRVSMEPCPVSSRAIREALRRGQLVRDDVVPAAVADYIAERGLYGAQPGRAAAER